MKEIFRILASTPNTNGFVACLDELEYQLQNLIESEGIRPNHWIVAKFFLSDAMNQWDILLNHSIYATLLPHAVICYIEQPPLNGSKVQLLLHAVQDDNLWREKREENLMIYGTTTSPERYFYHSIRLTAAEAKGKNPYAQTRVAFDMHNEILRGEGLTLKDSCQRTWIYVRDIDNQYMDAVVARNDLFDEEDLTKDTHFIASTGIGGITAVREASVAIDFFSVSSVPASKVYHLQALDYLNPTHEYGVAFERGTRVTCSTGSSTIFISGTASIDNKGECLYRGDVRQQTERLFLNIEQLLKDGNSTMNNVAYYIVYLRDVADYQWVNEFMHRQFPNIPFIITLGRVCRPEWLIEVECVALQ